MTTIRPPAVAGQFYPGDRTELRETVRNYLSEADHRALTPKALIVPHAGYIYSGPVAASGYAQLESLRDQISRVVLLGPSHFVPFPGLAVCSADLFQTPLGDIAIDVDAVRDLLSLPQVHLLDAAHAREHSLEVQLPFLQEVLDDFQLVPLVVGDASTDEVAEVIDRLWDGPQTLFVISSDLSHYHDAVTAKHLDRETSQAIGELRYEELGGSRACGYKPISGLLCVARRRGLHVQVVDLRNSGDTAGPSDRVVGYGAYVIE